MNGEQTVKLLNAYLIVETLRDVLCFAPPREPPHLYKYFQFSKCHLTPCRSSKIDQMRKTRCVKAYSFAEVLSLKVSTIKYAFNSLTVYSPFIEFTKYVHICFLK